MDSENGNREKDIEDVINGIEDEDTQPGWEPVQLRRAERRKRERRRVIMFVEEDRRSGQDRRSDDDRRTVAPRKKH